MSATRRLQHGAMVFALAAALGPLASDANALSAQLRWVPSAQVGVVGYRVFWRLLTGTYGAGTDVKLPGLAADGTMSYTMAISTGASYAFVVAGYLSTGALTPSSNERTLLAAPPPPAGVTVIPAQGGTFTGTTSGTGTQTGTCAASTAAPERVFQWTPAVSGTATIQTCGASTNFDTVLYMRGGSVTGAQVACNDDTAGCGITLDGTNPRRASRITPAVTAGQTYFIFVDGYGAGGGNFGLTVTPPAGTARTVSPPAAGGSSGAGGGAGTPATPGGAAGSGGEGSGACGDLQVQALLMHTIGARRRFKATAAFATIPGADPTIGGLTLRLQAFDGTMLLETTVPGSAFVKSGNGTFRYVRALDNVAGAGARLTRLQLTDRGGTTRMLLNATAVVASTPEKTAPLIATLEMGGACVDAPAVACRSRAKLTRCP